MKSWVWNLFVATNQWLRSVLTASFFSATLLLFKTRTSWFFLFFSFFTIPFCFDGLAMLEQGLHALSLSVSLLAGLLFFAWLLFSLGLTACSCEMYSLLRLKFVRPRNSNQLIKTLWPSFMIGAEIVGRKGDFVLKAVRLPVDETELFVCWFSTCLFWSFSKRITNLSPVLCSALGSDISHPWGATYWQHLPAGIAHNLRAKVHRGAPSLASITICWYAGRAETPIWHLTPPTTITIMSLNNSCSSFSTPFFEVFR